MKISLGLAAGLVALVAFTGCSSLAETSDGGQPAGTEKDSGTDDTSDATKGEENALESAESYLDSGAFSAKGLGKQLKFEGFTTKEVAYGLAHVDANWNDEAVESAQSYLDTGGFSAKGLAKQLKFEGFTTKEVAYGVANSGGDWNAEAAESAQSYLDSGSFSRKSLTTQLLFEGFTAAQAKYGVDQAGL